MMYFAIALAIIGTAAGFAFRWMVLLPIIVLMPFVVIIFLLSRDNPLEDALIIILVAEAVLQGGYFVGLLMSSIASAGMRSFRTSPVFKSLRAPETRRRAPPAEADNDS
ncbi:hypothetical protein [Bradyrhizobium sp. CCBAU 53421]|uniref:hypothetical protein n=1 Tax=Bradyrhizobium sp. CCBAU 53421 TaxID=1325120 RepID=UPI00188D74CF|nr:hypothetical protein [Bradyrhizobium sp. CCBAU 53421]QOZ32697.1 hypothetical protein XH92_14110 [Bradyrhizobium sp. CCBAU 53421]